MLRNISKFAEFTAAATDTTVHTVSTNRKAVITNIIVTNKEESDILVTLYDGASTGGESTGGDKKLEIKVATGDTKVISLEDEYGIEFRTSVVAQVDSYTTGSSIWIGGYEA